MEKLWSLQHVAESWGVSYGTLWRWKEEGRLPVVKLPGGALRVKDSEVQRILRERELVPA